MQEGSSGLGGIAGDNIVDTRTGKKLVGRVTDCSVGSKDNPLTLENSSSGIDPRIGGIAANNTGDLSGNWYTHAVIEYTSEFINPFSGNAGVYVKLITKARGTAPGGIAGSCYASEVRFEKPVDIYVDFQADTASDSSKIQYLGGIVGRFNESSEVTGPASGVSVICTAGGTAANSAGGQVYVGGIAGYWYSGTASNINVRTITLPDGCLSGYGQDTGSYYDHAGLVGIFYLTNNASRINLIGCTYGS